MDKFIFGKSILSQLLVMFFITGCLPSDVPKSTVRNAITKPGTCLPGTNCSAEGGTGIGTGTSLPPKVEIRHLIEPNLVTDTTYSSGTGYAGGGSYVRKLTIPKNFAGRLYVAGINIGSLASRHVKVRFKFGMNKEVVTIPATIAQAPGITPQTEISVLVMDLRSEPFSRIRLPYDLFDYNDYSLNPDGTFAAGEKPIQHNLNSGLYCRGLKLEDDPTFQGAGLCNDEGEQCLYAYAKVLDQGLVEVSGGVRVPLTPSFPQIKSVNGKNYFQDSMSYKFLKPLPDTISLASTNVFGSFKFSDPSVPVATSDISSVTIPSCTLSSDVGCNSTDEIFTGWGARVIRGTQYYYRGPYRLVNFGPDWQFRFNELDGAKRLFRKGSWVAYDPYTHGPLSDDDQSVPKQFRIYYNSYLFPLATNLELTANVSHLSSEAVDGERKVNNLPVAGKTAWMDGSNARAQSRNQDLEHIGSCNVSATIEIIAQDDKGIDYVISLANDVKLQLVRGTQYQTSSGNDVLSTNFKSCNGNSGCGGSECCFNNRCWDENLVSQCLDSSGTQGNKIIGETCATDLECSSLCCNKTTGQCAPHNTITTPAVLCSKPIGEFCIAKEWCQKSTVVKCLVVKTGTDPQGNTTCRQHCYNTQEYGDCKNGACVAPVQEQIPPFDPNAPGACNNAVPAPSF